MHHRRGAISRRIISGVHTSYPGTLPSSSSSVSDTSHTRLGQEVGSVVVDSDSCWLGSKSLNKDSDWREVVQERRFETISGAFVIGHRFSADGVEIVRDSIGEKNLYYTSNGGHFAFSSSLQELLKLPFVQGKLNLAAIVKYLIYAYIPGRETLIEGVYQLLPGECIRFEFGTLSSSQFWCIPPEPLEYRSEDELKENLRGRLERALMARIPQTDSLGTSLSGGIDSSLVLALLRKLYDGKVTTYSLSFGSEYKNELQYSSLMARHIGVEQKIIEITPSMVLKHLDETIHSLNLPIGDPLTVPNYLLFKEASQDVTHIFNGEGGDPCYGGPKNIPMVLAGLYGSNDEDSDEFTQESAYLRSHLKCYDDLELMLLPSIMEEIPHSHFERELAPYFSDNRWPSLVNKLQRINVIFKGGHHILPKIESLSRPFGVIPLSPLFDSSVVHFSFTIPAHLKLKGTIEKYLLKKAVSDVVPKEIIDRPKSGMLVPVEGWFQGPLLEFAKERILDGLAPYKLFKPEFLERLLHHKLGSVRPRHGAKIWLLLTLESWLRGYTERKCPTH
jgi:asparagine synthase (glutamine-hydrolysing)